MDKNSYQALDTTQEPGNLENLQFDNPNFTDPRDGNEYKTIRIGNQLWLAENLRYIPYVNKQSENGGIWVNGYSGNDVKVASMTEQFKKFGCLYSIENAFSVCPQGFHLPSNDEWLTLFYYFGGSNLAGNRLKACTGWKTITPQITDDSGFSALPGGCRTFYESFIAFGTVGYWWTSSAAQINKHFFMCIQDNRSTAIILQNKFPNSGFSIRCIKD
ncbi:MAG: hypothetical protein MUE37_01030 [Bacteroidales bacterium]|jgi:uncharacterized protein (TIGR02145 family)|nr:hypothetical protein [Bacteroidales bacterium]